MDPSKELPFLEAARNREEQIQLTNRIFQSAHLHGDGTLPVVEHRVMRPLTLNEISTLQGPCFSKCKDWGKLRLLLNPEESRMDQSPYLQQIVSFNNFSGLVVIGINSKEICDGEADLPVGIHSNALISNCILDAGCRVYRNMCMVDTYVGICLCLELWQDFMWEECFIWSFEYQCGSGKWRRKKYYCDSRKQYD